MNVTGDPLFHFVTLYLTRNCDLRCSYCGIVDKSKNASFDHWRSICERWIPYTRHFNILGGEPTLFKDLDKLIEFLWDRMGTRTENEQFNPFGMTTNGRAEIRDYLHLFDCGLRELNVSVDTLRPTKDKSVGLKSERCATLIVNPEIVKSGVDRMVNTVVTYSNIHEIPELVQKFSREGACCTLCVMQCGGLGKSSDKFVGAFKDDLKRLIEFFYKNQEQLILTEPMEYYETWLSDDKWHCTDKLCAPAIDNDGKLWGCYGFEGVHTSKLDVLSSPMEDVSSACRRDMSICKGCTWNCLWTWDAIATGKLTMDQWV